MSNALGNYDPIMYAGLALVQLEKQLGMASRVYRGYDKNPQEFGSTINLRRPTYFTAQSMPISSANTTDLNPDNISISLNQWYGVQFGLTDKELSYTQERIINEHIRPAAIAVADKIDQTLNALVTQIPWYYVAQNTGTATGVGDIPATRRRLFDNQVKLDDIHLELNGEREQWFLSQTLFIAVSQSGSDDVQGRGFIGTKFGFEIFANQNVGLQPAGGSAAVAGGTLTLGADLTAGATAVVLGASTVTGTLKVGDIVQVGHTATTGLSGAARTVARNFVVTAVGTFASNAVTVGIAPTVKSQETAASGTVCALKLQDSTKYDNVAFHRNFAALAMAPLPETAKTMGAQIASIADPTTGLALRVTMWYLGTDAKVYIRIDALWGVQLLNADMAARYVA